VQTEIIRLKQVDHIMSEKAILAAINHPMIISLYGTSQDDLHLYMYMEFVSGGELFSHLRRAGRFTNDTGKFFAASIVLALQHLHGVHPCPPPPPSFQPTRPRPVSRSSRPPPRWWWRVRWLAGMGWCCWMRTHWPGLECGCVPRAQRWTLCTAI
jgi:hypothetical protein